jgi:ABC-type amino acid transport substrate-binding protein
MKPSAPFLVTLLATLPGLGHAASPEPAELRFVVKNEDLPMPNPAAVQRFQELLGAALAHNMGRKVRFIGLPRKRMAAALAAGEGDILCGYTPDWMPGALEWSHPFIPVGDVLLSSANVPAPTRLEELKGKRIGTVLGFSYPDVEKKLGADFLRDDAPSSPLSLRKWTLGRSDYVLAPRSTVDKMIAAGAMPPGFHTLPVNEIKTMCAVPQHGNVSLKELNSAIDALEKSGEMARLLKAR